MHSSFPCGTAHTAARVGGRLSLVRCCGHIDKIARTMVVAAAVLLHMRGHGLAVAVRVRNRRAEGSGGRQHADPHGPLP